MREERLHVARLPVTTDRNPYQRLLYQHLDRQGIVLAGDGRLDHEWLDAHQREVDILHVHWRLDRLVDDGEPLGPPRRWPAGDAAAAAARLASQVARAQDLGYLLAWTVHEIAQLGGPEPTIEHLVAEVLGQRADVILTHNQVAAARLVELGVADASRITMTPLGNYVDAHRTGEGPLRADLGIAPTDTVLLAFGHQRRDKALHLLLDAIEQLGRSDVVLIIAGAADGPPASLTDRIVGASRVVWFGQVPDEEVVPLHRLADASVVARGYEWTPSSLVLSLSHGCPVIAADLASVAEHGGPGVFPFRPGDPSDLAVTIGRVLDDPLERRVRGEAGRAFVCRTTWEDTARATAAAMREAHRRRRQAP